VLFSFRGETHEIETRIDLDHCLAEARQGGMAEAGAEAPDFHLRLAQAGGIDPYSYLYEVLAAQDLTFSDPTGLAAVCCHDGGFDWAAFVGCCEAAEQGARALEIANIAHQHGIELDAAPQVAAALWAAYRAGLARGAD
jgi:hypothetical protein